MIFMAIVMLMSGVVSSVVSYIQVAFHPLTQIFEDLIQMF